MKENQNEILQQTRQILADEKVAETGTAMRLLVDIIRFHEWRYNIINEPLLSDTEFDRLFKLLQESESLHPELVLADSPSLNVSPDITEEFFQVEHLKPMLSLANSYNEVDLLDFDAQIRRLLLLDSREVLVYSVEPKFDGGSISAIYENDQLVRVATRGDGTKGEDITNNGMAIRSLPRFAAFSKLGIAKAEVRGEALISKSNFETLNKGRLESGQALFANARNAATGGLRTKDPQETADRRLDVFIYTLGYAVDVQGNDVLSGFDSHYESIEMLGQIGFKIPTEARKLCNNIQEVVAFCHQWQENREIFGYEIDGMVVKVDRRKFQERCGATAHHPRWAIAFKFQAKQAATKLLSVEYQIGKIGSVTPVGKLEPVALAGVTISSVSLHNEDFIASRDLRLGDTVIIERAGDVIPYIVKSLPDMRDGSEHPIVFPTHCPSCQSLLNKPEGEAAWRCINPGCPAQLVQKLIFFVSKDAMDIDGFGQSNVEKFFEMGWLKSFPDIYRLEAAAIADLEGYGRRSADKLIAAIEKSKDNPIHRLLHALSIHHLGKKASRLIAAEIDYVPDLAHWSQEQFESIKDIGPVVAANVQAYFGQKTNIQMLHELETLGVNLKAIAEDKKINPVNTGSLLFGKTILFTGTLFQMNRKEAQERAEQLGAKNISAVSSNLNILVVGEKAGSKLTKAKELGTVQIFTEKEFLDLIG